MDCIAEISYYFNKMLDAIKRFVDDSFVFQQDSAPVHLAFNAVQLMQCKTLNFLMSQRRI